MVPRVAISDGLEVEQKLSVVKSCSRVVFWTFSPKGGVAKTTLVRALRSLAKIHRVESAAYDGEGPRGQFAQYEATRTSDGALLTPDQTALLVKQEPLIGCVPFDIRDRLERDMLIDVAATDADVVFIDFPGGTLSEIKAIGNDDDTVEMIIEHWKQAGFRVVILVPIGPLRPSIRAIRDAIDSFKGAEILVAQMGAFVDSKDDFIQYTGYIDGEGTAHGGFNRELLFAAGGREMFVPGLKMLTYALLDDLSISYQSALCDKRVSDAHRFRIRQFLRNLRAALPDDLYSIICGNVDYLAEYGTTNVVA